MPAWLNRARAAAVSPPPNATKAAEWLLDNDYQVQRAILQAGEDLPSPFYERLPALDAPGAEAVPRIFAVAAGLLHASRLQLSLTPAVRFVRAYQEVAPLTIAELWAFPTMLRLVCLEVLIDGYARIFPQVEPPFPTTRQAAVFDTFGDTECVARAIANLAVVASIPWKDFFDRTSLVETVLADDPARVYPRMDFDTRDRYRKAVEDLAFGAGKSELEVAERVVTQARVRQASGPSDHVGHWLTGAGRRELESLLGYRDPRRPSFERGLLRHAGPLYAAGLLGASIAALVAPAAYLSLAGAGPGAWALGIGLALLPASMLAITAVNWLVTLAVPPSVLPKLDFEKSIPPDCATAVVVPVIIRDADEVPRLIERLQQHRLANPDPSLCFVLLSDLADAPGRTMQGDAEAEQALLSGIRRLNARYAESGVDPFHLLLRPRRHNPREDCWMGWERKRGKLEEFNRFVLGEDIPGFSKQEGDRNALRNVRFVVTVDADTTLPPGSVNRLVGTLAHPLNSARFDQRSGRVSGGYTVIQPRVEISPDSGRQSLFVRLYAGNTAIDIYSRAVSDVYQDLFGTGIYVGKGIYEVAPFHRSLKGRIPENALVSHDLFEGAHGRAGLASDVVLYEEFPRSYVEYARRWHRWVRGDWQLLPWLGRHVPAADGQLLPNRLSVLDRWKILDNLRRSLVPLSVMILAVAGWLVLPGDPVVWTVLTVAAPGAYLFTDLVTGLARGRRRGAVRGTLRQLVNRAGGWLLAVAFLAHDSWVAIDAIVRTLWRLSVSRRHLLEWTSAAHVGTAMEGRSPRDTAWRQMWVAPAFAVIVAAVVALLRPQALLPAAPLLLLWLASPEIAAWISRPLRPHMERLSTADRAFLRRLARRTWLYFETFVGSTDNWLPPDNYQEDPHGGVAHRTSPTNIGMMFVSSLSAWDLGFMDSMELSARIGNSLDALDRLERYRGHFLNWYDTQLMQPLEPRYVSTVDSGNLAVCLLALKEGCHQAALSPVLRVAQWDGFTDALDLLAEAMQRTGGAVDEFGARLAHVSERVAYARSDLSASWSVVEELAEQSFPALQDAIGRAVGALDHPPVEALHEVRVWLERTRHHLVRMRENLTALSPWLPLLQKAPPEHRVLALEIMDLLSVAAPMTTAVNRCAEACRLLAAAEPSGKGAECARWLSDLEAAFRQGGQAQAELCQRLDEIAGRVGTMAFSMDFRPLFNAESRLFWIGYNVSSDRIDPSHYDLLASEARLASFFAIAKGDVPFEHWFFLGRPITRTGAGLSLVSWNGSMFEYLMPPLLLRSPPGTLLGQSERAAVDAQRHYASERGIPWGISESAFAERNPDQDYRYRAFGVPELGLRRGISHDLVVAPYATALALPFRAEVATGNLRDLERLGLVGTYGLFEAADFTPERVPAGSRFVPVQAYMAHHQGMILGALANTLCDDILVRRLHADPRMRTAELLLQERVPWELPPEIRVLEEREAPLHSRSTIPPPHAWEPRFAEAAPQVHVLGNGRLTSWTSEAGGGGLQWHEHALTRWHPDPTRDNHGVWVYVRDDDDGTVWSVGRQPTGAAAERAHVIFHPHMAEFHSRVRGVSTRMEIGVAPGDDLEIRRITVVNESEGVRRLRFTSYGEVVIAPRMEDERHPAFSKLFVGSEYLPETNGLLFTRRPRNPRERPPVLLHRVVPDESGVEIAGFDTDRRSFLGRNRDPRRPLALQEGLSGTTGWTLDAVMALDVRIELAPDERRQFAFVTMAAASRESVLQLTQRYATLAALDWALSDAATEADREARQLGLRPNRLPELQALVSLLLYQHPALRAAGNMIAANRLGQSRLWGFGISGDRPILLVHARDPKETDLLRTLIAGHQLWRKRGISVDLVILRAGVSGYVEPFRERLLSLLQECGAQELLGRDGGVHMILADQVGEEERRLLEASARVVLDVARGTLAEQLAAAAEPRSQPPRFEPGGTPPPSRATPALTRAAGLGFDNGIGGFTPDGREYLIHLEPHETTPAPWCNVIANEQFGTIVTEAGGGFTWALNSGENRLTPWTNDPVSDPPSEVVYIRDEETAEFWTPTPEPAGEGESCEVRHGAGYTVWRRHSHALEQTLTVFVPSDDPVKIARVELRNLEARARRITVTYYVEWVLGGLGSARSLLTCEYDPTCHALLARNPWNPDFAERVAFLTSSHAPHSLTTDRRDFIGREGDLRSPAGLLRWDLGGRVRPGADPCAAFQVHVEVGANAATEVVFVLGQGRDAAEAADLAIRWQDQHRVGRAFEDMTRDWDRRLGAIQVRTPDPAFDLMLNRWLLYQTLASRVLARAGFYQAGGAIGFRDQLQDVLALLHVDPKRVRDHILTVAARQFKEGDVLHWWHPPNNRGVRTRCSDDLLWLPYVTGCYVEATGDESILHEEVPFLEAPPLAPEEDDRYARFDAVSQPQTLFDHCERALERGLTRGSHGLPLIGSGDWNDGMDRVGREGRGESVWLAWFIMATITRFAALSRLIKRDDLADAWVSRSARIERAVEAEAWDGDWYVRAFDDEGRAIGSARADECRIDSIAQSWAVLAGHGTTERARTAIESAARNLVREDEQLARLLWPPFDTTPRDPGYIKAYPPGIRENGGQYSHAAAWLGHAHVGLGDGKAAARVFDCLSPIRRASTRAGAELYRVEPYVLAGDIGSVPPHVGRGGWSWYTGSAAWTWRLGIEAILGLRLREGRLIIDPCIPNDWGHFEAEVKMPTGTLAVVVEDPDGVGRGTVDLTVDGSPHPDTSVAFPTDGSLRRVVARLGRPQ